MPPPEYGMEFFEKELHFFIENITIRVKK